MPNSRPEAARLEQGSGFQDFSLLLASRIVSLAAGVAFVAVTARLFSAAEITFLAWVTILAAAAETVRGFGLTNVLTRRLPVCADDPVEAGRWIATHFRFASLPLLLAPLLLVPLAPPIWTVAAAGAGLQLVVNNHIYVFQAMGRFREVSAATIGSTLLQRAAPLALAWYWRLDLEAFLWAQFVLSVPVCLALTWQLWPYLSSAATVGWREFWPQARAFYAAGFVRYGATQADQVLAAVLFPPETLAPYFLVRRLYSAVVVVLSAGVDAIIPQFGRRALDGIEQVRHDQARVLRKATAVCALGGCVLAANAGALVPLAIGSVYAAPRLVTPMLMVAALGYGLFALVLAGEAIAGPPRETFRITTIAALVPLAVAPVLVPLAGVAALPMAMTAGYLAAAWGVLRSHAELRFSAWLAVAAMAAVGLLCGVEEGLTWSPRAVPAPIFLNVSAVALAAILSYRCGFPFGSATS